MNTARLLLERDGAPVHVEPQVFKLLCFLIENRGRAVTKDEIFEAIWEGRAISDAVLTTRIRALRRAIDDVGAQSMIRTVHRVGYEFVPEVLQTDMHERETEPLAQGDPARPEERGAGELRQAVVVAIQPRLALDEAFDPEQLDHLITSVRNQLADRLDSDADDLVEAAEGTLYAIIGALVTHEDDVERAAKLALDFAGKVSSADAGLAVAIGKGRIAKARSAVRGSAVLRAAQAVGHAKAGEVLISPELIGQFPAGAELQIRPDHMAHLSALPVQEIPTPSPAPFVGRLVEAGLIESAVRAMLEKSSGGCITLEGPAGVGKSRLADRAAEMLLSAGGRVSHVYLRELSADGVLQRNVIRGFADTARGLLGTEVKAPPAVVSVVSRAISGTLGSTVVPHSVELGETVIELMRRASEDSPLMIIIEDAHWIDPESRKLALQLAAVCSEMSAVLLVTARPSARGFLDELSEQAQGDIVALALGPLSSRQSMELVGALAPELDNETRQAISARAAGNPLFVTRLVEAYRAKGPASFQYVPGTIQSVVQVQFDQLDPQRKDQLRRLSVLGERFETVVAETVYGEGDAAGALTPGFLRESNGWYHFAHNLVRESIYSTIPQDRRRALHTAAAKRLVPHDPLLAAEHAMRGNLDEAAAICVKVARDTFHFRRHGRSVALIEQATQLECTPDQRAQLEVFLGSAAIDLGDEDKALEFYARAAERAETSLPAVFALVRTARVHIRQYRSAEAHAVLDRADDWVKRDPGPGYLASEIAETRAMLAWIERRPSDAIQLGEEARRLSDHPHASGRAIRTLGWAYFSSARFGDARRCGDACLKLVQDNNLRLVEPDILGPALRFRWYDAPSEDRLEEANAFVHRAEEIGMRLIRVQVRVVRAEIAWELGAWSVFDEDAQAIASEIVADDRLSLATLKFFQALRGREDHQPFPGLPGADASAFLPLSKATDTKIAPPEQNATPLEQLWLGRLEGRTSARDFPGFSDDMLTQCAGWLDWAAEHPIRP
ncbi:MAG: winged helix-turn-helix domain-containing protein [Pseudomonadota bacterium]